MILLFGCTTQESYSPYKETSCSKTYTTNSHTAIIKLNKYKYKCSTTSSIESLSEENLAMRINETIDTSSLLINSTKRVFPYADKYEERHIKEGLDRWYYINYNEIDYSAVKKALSKVEFIETIEDIPKRKRFFNDPMLYKQWNFINTGTNEGQISGSDINIEKAWLSNIVGNNTVIVSIVDGGIDYSHEDLNGNMWKNPNKSGNQVYGYNFVDKSFNIVADEHGTHVAGIIAAVNNNSKGICGIAGGDSKTGNQGVLLMSCQVFEGNNQTNDFPEAIVWGCDHGAVISQNSWGYDLYSMPNSKQSTSEVDKIAIDYFNKYAGFDEKGNQVGPMAGGIVFFAAGNDNASIGYPAEYEGCIAVASIGADYKKSDFSNYGPWVDIAAPGGDQKKGSSILSTLPGNKYGPMSGTSMACPHASGIAALIISRLGGIGYTREMLIERIMSTATDITDYNDSRYYIGSGLINATAATLYTSTISPDPIINMKINKISSNQIYIDCSIPKDDDDRIPHLIKAYYNSNLSKVTEHDSSQVFIIPHSLKEGDIYSISLNNLKHNTEYTIATTTLDYSGNSSTLSKELTAKTTTNNPPYIDSSEPDSITIKAAEDKEILLYIEDPDCDELTVSIDSPFEGFSIKEAEDHYVLLIKGRTFEAGNYSVEIKATDIYGAYCKYTQKFTVLPNSAPISITNIDNIVMNDIGIQFSRNISIFFYDSDNDNLSFSTKSGNELIAHSTINNSGLLQVHSHSYGQTNINVTAQDAKGAYVSSTFNVLVRDGSNEIDVFPNPVTDTLFVRTSTENNAVNIVLYSPSGKKIISSSQLCGPYKPIKIIMSSYSWGTYQLIVKCNSKIYYYSIIKK